MPGLSQRNRRVINEHYGLVPRPDVPRATFNRPHELKTTFTSGYLTPILVDEVLPGDVHTGKVSIFARLADLIFPLMDNVTVETQFFFVPMRILWDNAKHFWGELTNPTDTTSYVIPTVTVTPAAVQPNTLWDHMGIPPGMLTTNKTINALPFRAYTRIYNEWYRDQNLQNSDYSPTDDGPDTLGNYFLRRRGKKHDYFTSALPAPQRGSGVTLPLAGQAPVKGIGTVGTTLGTGPTSFIGTYGTADGPHAGSLVSDVQSVLFAQEADGSGGYYAAIYADLSVATATTINALRLAVQTQKLLETDARGGTRYTEQLQIRWGVKSQDARLQRPEYIGGGVSEVQTTAIAKTTDDGTSPLGSLAGQATVGGQHSFTCIGHEHGYIIGIASVMTRPSYQQGINRLYTRSTRFDFATPEFTALGEQAIRNDEIYATGGIADTQAFGYQERYGEYRFSYNRIAGLFRSQVTGNIDEWHLAQEFLSLPTLGETFIRETAPFSRVFAAGTDAGNQEILADILFKIKSTRPLPAYGIPGGMKGTF